MAGVSNPVFNEVERKISKHSLEIPIDLNEGGAAVAHKKRCPDDWVENQLNGRSSESTSCLTRGRGYLKFVGMIIINALILTYLVFASLHWSETNDNCELEWCDGYGMLLIILSLTYGAICYYQIVKKYCSGFFKRIWKPVDTCLSSIKSKKCTSLAIKSTFYSAIFLGFIAFLIYDTVGSRDRLISAIGVCSMLTIAFVFSKYPRQVNWRPVIWGLILQFGFGLITIRWTVGRAIFQCLSQKVAGFLEFAQDGASFVFTKHLVDEGVFAFAVLPVIFFFSFMIQILYYWGVMQWIIMKLGWALHAVMGTTVCESLNAAANTFLGMTESPLLIKPYICKLTSSEIHAVMCSGFATVSGTVLAAYISFGAQPSHLITASVMSAPAALCFSKLFYPETEKSQTTFKNIPLLKSEDSSVMDAATKGALAGIPLVLGIIANIVAFISFISFFNAMLSWLGTLVGYPYLTFEYILSKVFMPLSWIMGVPWEQCEHVATLIGLKTVVNEFVAYQKLGEFKKAGKLTPRVEGIATFAICGFANPASIGIMIGGLSAMAPDKREQITSVTMRAFVAGSAVCFMTASIAGMLMNEDFYSHETTNQTITSHFIA